MGAPACGAGLVLSGTVAHGAFEAGALEVLAEEMAFERLVGTSAGALNATVAAAGLARGRFSAAAEELSRLWVDEGSLCSVLAAAWPDGDSGLLSTRRLQQLIEGALAAVNRLAVDPAAKRALLLTVITTSLAAERKLDKHHIPYFTHEHPFAFDDKALVDERLWGQIATAAAASAAFPFLFAPTEIGQRYFIDGGAVNNAAISHLLDDETIREVVVVSPMPLPAWSATSPSPPVPRPGVRYLWADLPDLLINERIWRDLYEAERRNEKLSRIGADLAQLGIKLTPEQQAAVSALLGWRPLQLMVVRPAEPLPGVGLRGFFSRPLRQRYVELGRQAARAALAARR